MNVVRKSSLGEISFVDLGADGQTTASVAASKANNNQNPNSQEESITMETSVNLNVAANTATAMPHEMAEAAAPAAVPPATATTPAQPASLASAIAEIRAAALAETNRIAAIRQICAGKFPEIEAQAIREGWDATRCELEVLRASRPKAPAVHVQKVPASPPASLKRPA